MYSLCSVIGSKTQNAAHPPLPSKPEYTKKAPLETRETDSTLSSDRGSSDKSHTVAICLHKALLSRHTGTAFDTYGFTHGPVVDKVSAITFTYGIFPSGQRAEGLKKYLKGVHRRKMDN